MFRKALVLAGICLVAASTLSLSGCGGSAPALSVAVTAAATTVDGNDTTTLTGAVTNDKNSAGVTWTLSGAGALSNTTATSATYTAPAPTSSAQSATITATSIADTTKSGTATITIPATPSVTSTSASLAGAVGTAYSITLQASGGIAPYTWALGSGTTLPACLTLKSAGVLTTTTGTPPAASCAGTFSNITFKITDSGTPTPLTETSSALTITIAPAPAITFTGAVPATGTYNAAYSGSAAATGGAGALTYSVASGALPGGLNLNASTGAITGTPSAAGTFNFVIQAADAYGDSNTQSYQIVVSYPAVVITPGAGSLPLAVTGQSYAQTLTASGGSGTGFTWTVTGLPANGLTYSASGATLAINGPATTTGTVNFTAKVTDGAGNSIGPYAYSIQVYSPVTLPATIPSTLPSTATVNVAFSGTVAATGGSGNYSWTVTGLSDGLTSSTSSGTLTISGTPTAAATVTANVSVKDTTTNVTAGPYAYAITVYATVTLPTSNPPTLGPAIVSTPYNGTIVAAGGSGNYSWTVTGLPSDSLNYSTSGATITVSGTPGSTPTTVNFTAKVTDTSTNLSSGPYDYSVTVYNPVTLSSTSLPLTATVNAAYSGTITASGGSGTGYVWAVTGMSDGLNSASSGGTLTISGTPTSAATVNLAVSVKDSVGNSAGPTNYTITVYGALSLPASDSLPGGYTGVAYTGSVTGTGGSSNLSIAITTALSPSDGTLAANVSGATVNVTGTPTTATTVSFSVKLTDTTTSNFITQTYSITITTATSVSLPAPNPTSLGSATQNQSYTGFINASGGVAPYAWSINGTTVTSSGPTLGNGTLAASNTGGNTLTISGTPSASGTVTLTNVKVVDSLSSSDTKTYTLTVSSQSTLQVSVDLSSLPQGMVNMPYTFDGGVNISGGTGPYTITYQDLPAGLSEVTQHNYDVEGTPTSSGTTTVTVNVSDSSSTVQHASTTFDLKVVPQTTGTNNSRLSGQYACYLMEYWQGGVTGGGGKLLYRGGAVFALSADGNGNITGGEIDVNSPGSGYHSASSLGALGGTYAVGSDDRGYMILTVGGQAGSDLALAGGNLDSNSHFTEFAILKMDDVGTSPSGQYGGGHCYKQNTTTSLNGIPAQRRVRVRAERRGYRRQPGIAGWLHQLHQRKCHRRRRRGRCRKLSGTDELQRHLRHRGRLRPHDDDRRSHDQRGKPHCHVHHQQLGRRDRGDEREPA